MDPRSYKEEVDSAIRSGRWWERSWWRESIYETQCRLRPDQVEASFYSLQEVFSVAWADEQIDGLLTEVKTLLSNRKFTPAYDEWLREKLLAAQDRADEFHAVSIFFPPKHPVFGYLFNRGGLDSFMFLYRLGRGLHVLKEKGLLGDLPGRLKKEEGFDGAYSELDVVANWIGAGVEVKRHIPGKGGKNCDLEIRDGVKSVFVEVKHLKRAVANSERAALTDAISSKVLNQLHAHGLDGLFELEMLVRPSDREAVGQLANATDGIASQIAQHAEQHREDRSGDWRTIAGLARYRHILSADGRGTHGWVAGVPVDGRCEADKIMGEVLDHVEQIPAGGPGLFIIIGNGNPNLIIFGAELPSRIIEHFNDGQSTYADIAGVLILRRIYSQENGEAEFGIFVRNPKGPSLHMELLRRGVPNLEVWSNERPAESQLRRQV